LRDPRSVNPRCPARFYQSRAAHHPPAAGSSDVIPIPVSRPVDRGSRSRIQSTQTAAQDAFTEFPSGTGEAPVVKLKIL
jgi:hypothetical protein